MQKFGQDINLSWKNISTKKITARKLSRAWKRCGWRSWRWPRRVSWTGNTGRPWVNRDGCIMIYYGLSENVVCIYTYLYIYIHRYLYIYCIYILYMTKSTIFYNTNANLVLLRFGIPPFNSGIFRGLGQEISQKYFTWPHEIYPPRMFLGFQQKWGGPPDATF